MENKLPTAEEFLSNLQFEYEETGEYKMYFAIDIPNKLREFAKLHVEQALKAALESIPCLGSSSDIATYGEVEEAVLNAYPPDKIK